MQLFTGFEYLLIDVANQYGLDKELFETRIQWAKANLLVLESLINDVKPKNRALYFKACLNIRRAQAGKPIGALVGFDAICSGIQVMSALTGCADGLRHTGLIGDNVRADAYSTCTGFMSDELGGFDIERDLAKDALMKMCYGSQKEPEEIFGKDTRELVAFYIAAEKTAPGAYALLQELKAAWQPYALAHEWTLPDGFHARVRVKETVSCRPKIDELGGASFTYVYKEYMGTETGISLPANVTHSVDAYVLRCVVRRCNYNRKRIEYALDAIQTELMFRNGEKPRTELKQDTKLAYYVDLYNRTGMPDIVIVSYIDYQNTDQLSTSHMCKLRDIMNMMIAHQPFPVVTNHDEFKCHPNNMDHVRLHYREIFAQLAESKVLQSIMNEITGNPNGKYKKRSNNLGNLIRQSNYAIC